MRKLLKQFLGSLSIENFICSPPAALENAEDAEWFIFFSFAAETPANEKHHALGNVCKSEHFVCFVVSLFFGEIFYAGDVFKIRILGPDCTIECPGCGQDNAVSHWQTIL